MAKNKNSENNQKIRAHSILEIRRIIDEVEKVVFYIIPSRKEDLFLNSPELVDTSLDAKSFYLVEANLYDTNPSDHNIMINHYFDHLSEIMGVSAPNYDEL